MLLFILLFKANLKDYDIIVPLLGAKLRATDTLNGEPSLSTNISNTVANSVNSLPASSNSNENIKSFVQSYIYGNNLFVRLFSAHDDEDHTAPIVNLTRSASTLLESNRGLFRRYVTSLHTVTAIIYVAVLDGLFVSYTVVVAPVFATILPVRRDVLNPELLYFPSHVIMLAVSATLATSCITFISLYFRNIFRISLELRGKNNDDNSDMPFLDSIILVDISG